MCHAFKNAGHTVAAFRKHDLNVVRAKTVWEALARERPHFVVHCAAYTNVNRAEAEPEEAFAINETGARNVAEACASVGAKMVHISTDFVFDGTKATPYVETDAVNPLNVYGKSKAAGENAVRQTLPDAHLIIRTAWLYGGLPHAKNFVRTIYKLAQNLPTVPVVCDQIGSPTCTMPVAQTLVALCENFAPGTCHAACEGEESWFEFAREIVRLAHLKTAVVPITAAQYAAQFGVQAPRPAYSALDNAALRTRGIAKLPHWKRRTCRFFENGVALFGRGLTPGANPNPHGFPTSRKPFASASRKSLRFG